MAAAAATAAAAAGAAASAEAAAAEAAGAAAAAAAAAEAAGLLQTPGAAAAAAAAAEAAGLLQTPGAAAAAAAVAVAAAGLHFRLFFSRLPALGSVAPAAANRLRAWTERGHVRWNTKSPSTLTASASLMHSEQLLHFTSGKNSSTCLPVEMVLKPPHSTVQSDSWLISCSYVLCILPRSQHRMVFCCACFNLVLIFPSFYSLVFLLLKYTFLFFLFVIPFFTISN